MKNKDDVLVLLQEDCSRHDPAMDPFYEVRYGLNMVWQIPADPKATIAPIYIKDRWTSQHYSYWKEDCANAESAAGLQKLTRVCYEFKYFKDGPVS
ncbi:unnamed protein product [Calypogeia fissa]